MKNYTLEIIKAKGKRIGAGWAIKPSCTAKLLCFGHYKVDGLAGLSEWQHHDSDWNFERDFYHNFYSADELGMEILPNDCDKKSW